MHQAPKTQQQPVIPWAEWHKRCLGVPLPYSCRVQRSWVTPSPGTCPAAGNTPLPCQAPRGRWLPQTPSRRRIWSKGRCYCCSPYCWKLRHPSHGWQHGCAQLCHWKAGPICLNYGRGEFCLSSHCRLSGIPGHTQRKKTKLCLCRQNSNFLTYSSSMTGFLWLISALLWLLDGEEERGWQPAGSRCFPWLPQA